MEHKSEEDNWRQRLTDCWNNCDKIRQQRDKAQQQRDDLLEACEVLIKHPECLSCRIAVEKAIANAK